MVYATRSMASMYARNTIVYLVRLGITDHVLERRHHDVFQLFVDHRLFPEVALPVLHPLEIRCGDAAGIGQNVGHYEDMLVAKDVIGGRRRGPVGAFDQDLCFHLVGIARVDDVLRGRRNQDFAIGDQQLLGVGTLRALEAVYRAFLLAIFP